MHRLLIGVAFLMALPAAAQQPETAARGAVSGVVQSADGRPIAGATVMVWTAGVKEGYSTYCPSCYADCGKQARTGDDGRFTVPSLDGDLIFRFLAVAEGFQPSFVPGVDPLSGEIVAIAMTPRQPVPAESGHVISGRIIDEDGSPVAGAAIEPDMVMWRDENGQLTGRGGAVEGLDPLAISNEDGKFELAYLRPVEQWSIRVHARGFARRNIAGLATADAPHTVVLTRGGTLTGRLVHNGEPVPNALMGISHVDRSAGTYLGNEVIGTDDHGRFTFVNMPAGVEWFLYAKMDTVKHLGATDVQRIRIDQDNQVVEVGDVPISEGFRLSGRVVLPGGESLPPGMRIMMSHDSAWDSQILELPSDGSFDFVGLFEGRYSLSPMVRGYRLKGNRLNVQRTMQDDVEGVVIELEAGRWSPEGP